MPIDMPTVPGFVACRFWLETHSQRFTSQFTNATQRRLLAGARWSATYTLPDMSRAQAAAWQAFLEQLEGSVNTFNAYDPDREFPRGIGTGTPLVNGASQTGSSLITDGWTASVTNILMAGDLFTVNSEMKVLTANASSNGSGQATLSFKPALRNSPADNAALTVQKPTCTMILIDDLQGAFDTGSQRGFYKQKTFSAVEPLA